MTRSALALLALLPTVAVGEPISIKGLAPGMTKEQAELAHAGITKLCRPAKTDQAAEVCGYMPKYKSLGSIPSLDTLAGADAIGWMLVVKNGAVNTLSVRMAARDFDRVTAAMQERWGNPSKREESVIQNRMGATFDQVHTEWRVAGSVLVAKKRGGQVDEMSIYLSTEDRINEGARERREDRPKVDAQDM